MEASTRNPFEAYASRGILLLGAVIGLCSFAYYYLHGLSTVHYDAKAHLVVARRIVDSTAPGYSQMGAHWLPLIHLLYLPFVLIDSQYRTALIPSLMSVCAFALSAWLVYRISMRLTGSVPAGLFAAAMLLANPNLQFLQSAPLTEPVYMLFSLLALDGLLRWRARGGGDSPWLPAIWAALGALCRYEGWVFLAGAVALIVYDMRARRFSRPHALRAIAVYLGVFAVPVMAHFGYIYAHLGDSFFQRVARGNPAPYETYRRPFLSVLYHFGELAQAAALVPLLIGLAGVVYCLLERDRLRRAVPYFLLWLPCSLNISALYWGLIYRVRYSSLLLPAVGVFGSLILANEKAVKRVTVLCCVTVFLLPWISWLFPSRWEYHFVYPGPGILLLPAAALVLLLAAAAGGHYRWALLALAVLSMQAPVFEGESRPMLSESFEHRYLDSEQQELLSYLGSHYDGSRILIDVGQLAPLMYDSGLPLKQFVYHDGDLTDWDRAAVSPRNHVGWICAEKGDEIWGMLHVDPHWADGYSLCVKTENYVMYQLNPESRNVRLPTR
ncbi:MAG: glycosyltransferase family 39 protein [Acidobacteriia bacterium]|nr:glycosyltransferase family 39 protein [Terriglobia bacterium]